MLATSETLLNLTFIDLSNLLQAFLSLFIILASLFCLTYIKTNYSLLYHLRDLFMYLLGRALQNSLLLAFGHLIEDYLSQLEL
jgi:hypothetical protein